MERGEADSDSRLEASGSQAYKFTGKPFSTATGLYYDYQRWYDPSIGRFISQDPLAGDSYDPQYLKLYVYVLNAPTRLGDPAGADYKYGVNHEKIGSVFLPEQPPIVTSDFWQKNREGTAGISGTAKLAIEP